MGSEGGGTIFAACQSFFFLMKNRIGRKPKGRIPEEEKLKKNGGLRAERRGKRDNHTKRADWLVGCRYGLSCGRGRQKKLRDKAHKPRQGLPQPLGRPKASQEMIS